MAEDHATDQMDHDNSRDIAEPGTMLCPITQVMFQDPVVNMYGHTYERQALQQALRLQLRDPLTNLPLPYPDGGVVYVNRAVRSQVDEFLEQHPGHVPEGWVDRRRTTVAVDSMLEEEVAQLQQLQAWAIRKHCPVQDLYTQVRRFILGFMFRPKALLPPAESTPRVGKVLAMIMGVWLGDELSLLGAHIGWKLIVGLLRIATGVNVPIVAIQSNLLTLAKSVLLAPFLMMTSKELLLSGMRPSRVVFGRSRRGNRAFFMKSCEKDIWYFQSQVSLFEILRQGVVKGPSGIADRVERSDLVLPPMRRATIWQVSMQNALLKLLINLACLHAEFAGIEVGYKTACTAYNSSRNAVKAVLSSCLACTRLGVIAGCGYAISALHINAALAFLSSLGSLFLQDPET